MKTLILLMFTANPTSSAMLKEAKVISTHDSHVSCLAMALMLDQRALADNQYFCVTPEQFMLLRRGELL